MNLPEISIRILLKKLCDCWIELIERAPQWLWQRMIKQSWIKCAVELLLCAQVKLFEMNNRECTDNGAEIRKPRWLLYEGNVDQRSP